MIETASYKVKTYSPEFFEDEIKLTQQFQERHELDEFYLSFAHENQINNVKNFRENGAPNFPFIPTDHWYLFDESENLVGHIHAYPQQNTKRCVLSAPVTAEGHEKGAELLFNTLVDSVKERGYDTLVMNSTENHVIEQNFLKEFDFDQISIRNIRSNNALENLHFEKSSLFSLEDYNAEKHREDIITKLYLPKGYQRERMDQQFDGLATSRDNGNVPSWVVAYQEGELVGQSVAFYGRPRFPNLAQFNTVTTNLEGEESIPLINTIYAQHVENLPEKVERVEHYLFAQVINLREIYEKIGFTYLENHLYERKI